MSEAVSTGYLSILFESEPAARPHEDEEPDFFQDLNLDRVLDGITLGYAEYDLKPIFYAPLSTPEAVKYRQAIMRDLENEAAFVVVKAFAESMRSVRGQLALAKSGHHPYVDERWLLDAAATYCEAVAQLKEGLNRVEVTARGLAAFRAYLEHYVNSEQFKALSEEVRAVKAGLGGIRYGVLVNGGCVTVQALGSEPDYAASVEETFAKFRQGGVKDYRVTLPSSIGTNHVAYAVLERVARLFPEAFRALDEWCERHREFLDDVVVRFDREVQFYIAYLDYMRIFKRRGLMFCYPDVSTSCKDVLIRDGYDLALADKLAREGETVVCNEFMLRNEERILVVTGPNQGGKTTYARAFGQIHYLAGLGCPVPGSQARVLLFDRLFTHFERIEDVSTLRGKLKDDLVRIHEILQQVTSRSIVILNEIFSSTTVADAVLLGREVLDRLSRLDALCVCVTFLDELAAPNERRVSLVATVNPDNPAVRTYRIVRRPADGRAYALAIAEKYGLTYEQLRKRMTL